MSHNQYVLAARGQAGGNKLPLQAPRCQLNQRRQRIRYLQCAALGLVALWLSLATGALAADKASADLGKQLYIRECASCHGPEGDGNGPGAYILSQKPRNLQLGVFKLRSTPTGENPTDDDLFNTITRGIAGATGAMMPSFASLSESDRWALAISKR